MDSTVWDYLPATYGESVATELFTRILDPTRIPHRAPYPGVVRTMGARGDGPAPYPWLREHFCERVETARIPLNSSPTPGSGPPPWRTRGT